MVHVFCVMVFQTEKSMAGLTKAAHSNPAVAQHVRLKGSTGSTNMRLMRLSHIVYLWSRTSCVNPPHLFSVVQTFSLVR